MGDTRLILELVELIWGRLAALSDPCFANLSLATHSLLRPGRVQAEAVVRH